MDGVFDVQHVGGHAVFSEMYFSVALPTATVTAILVSGQDVTVTYATTGAPTSGLATLLAANPAEGAISQGPVTLDFPANGVASAIFRNASPGKYQAPSTTVSNATGTASASGGGAVTILGLSGTPQVPQEGEIGVTPLVAIASVAMNGKTLTASGTVNLQGDGAGTLIGYLDPQPSGSALGPFAVTVNAGNWTYSRTPIAASKWKLRIVATANGQTATALSAEFTVLGLAGSVTLPTV